MSTSSDLNCMRDWRPHWETVPSSEWKKKHLAHWLQYRSLRCQTNKLTDDFRNCQIVQVVWCEFMELIYNRVEMMRHSVSPFGVGLNFFGILAFWCLHLSNLFLMNFVPPSEIYILIYLLYALRGGSTGQDAYAGTSYCPRCIASPFVGVSWLSPHREFVWIKPRYVTVCASRVCKLDKQKVGKITVATKFPWMEMHHMPKLIASSSTCCNCQFES